MKQQLVRLDRIAGELTPGFSHSDRLWQLDLTSARANACRPCRGRRLAAISAVVATPVVPNL